MVTVSMGRERTSGFAGLQLDPALLRAISATGFEEPRAIQARTIPAALAGRDVLGLAQTGTGKTAAFVLPILERLLGSRRPGPRALIVAPTRELATQIAEECRSLARFVPLRLATIFGGVPERPQIEALRADPEIVVACPGRLLDLHARRLVRLDRIEILVLDEADHMFDMGFLPDLRRILGALPERRQSLLFSATMPPEIRRLADDVLHDAHVVELGHSRPVSTVDHALLPVATGEQKLQLLEQVLAEEGFVSAIVFTRTKQRARRLARQLEGAGHRAIALQGNMSQRQREQAMEGFRARRYRVLVATDLAARGIDVAQVSHVVNFDMPGTPDAYTHRIGRTGRAERTGKAYTFITAEDHALVRAVERKIGSSIPRFSFGASQHPAAPAPTPASSRGSGSVRSWAPRSGSRKPR